MPTINISYVITDSAGTKYTGSGTASTDTITASAVVSPDPAPAGTKRTITVTAASSQGLPLTYQTPTANDASGNPITFTPVAGQPNAWTFTL